MDSHSEGASASASAASGVSADAASHVLDEEQRILATILAMPDEGSRKRRREEIRHTRGPCHEYRKAGSCRFGARCRFAHDEQQGPSSTTSARVVLRKLTEARAVGYELGGSRVEAMNEDGTSASTNTAASASAAAAASTAMEDAHAAAASIDDTICATDGDAAPGDAENPDDDEMREAAAMDSMRQAGHVMTPLSMVQRYYTRLYAPDMGGVRGDDQFVYLQSNRICIVGLAPSHSFFREGHTATKIEFASQVADMHISGKRKKGVVFLEPYQVVATIHTTSGKVFSVRAGMRSGVVEVNKRLVLEPHLLNEKPATAGHIAVLECKLHRILDVHKSLLSQPLYERLCEIRGFPSTYPAAVPHAIKAASSSASSASLSAAEGHSVSV
jgi:hypothetical protein